VLRHLLEVVVVFAYCYAALRGLETLLGSSDALLADAALAAAKFLLFVVVLIPWIVLAERRTGALTMLREPLMAVLGKLRK
jgi:hypothetical protein